MVALADLDCRDDAKADCARAPLRMERAIAIQRSAYGATHSVLQESLRTLAVWYEDDDRDARALSLRKELLAIATAGGDEDEIESAQADLASVTVTLQTRHDD